MSITDMSRIGGNRRSAARTAKTASGLSYRGWTWIGVISGCFTIWSVIAWAVFG